MDFELATIAGGLRVILRGRLTISENVAFRRMVSRIATTRVGGERVEIDLTEVAFIDSVGLGLLLHVRDALPGRAGEVILTGATGQVGRMLDPARFGDLFDLAA
jgi:anti-anti-sigma factor